MTAEALAAAVRVVLVDDQELVRTGLRLVVDSQHDMTVVGEAGNGAAALQLLSGVHADVVVMDVRMPVMDGIEATAHLTGGVLNGSTPKVLVLTTFEEEEEAFAALRAGASGFLLKNGTPEDLLSAVRVIASGDAIVAPRITKRLLDRFAPQFTASAVPDRRLSDLTSREHEVVLLIARGLSNLEIGDRLGVAEATVKSHVRRILTKLALRDRVQIVVLAYESGLVRPHR
ncbi:response regulator [Phytomonospora endophytica]|uniref:DNA-binding NarL/FixJ family response regulator n=1 Tax=Phytomonospora endophytica TaxID=714109 RepID=A0A841FI06_9ACTN|nr:response regulator transcription factor [Phytomonospora endophytica]MBB6034593.1 DNA-binding NarL/FixJ family response regulator [Phytomonospora endophytica]GIG71347.1 DNA-binding response regulator [Phytomonospora endophytica]